MENETKLIDNITAKLTNRLGVSYRVVPSYLSSTLDDIQVTGSPDIIVYGNETKEVFMIEVKGSSMDDELPRAVVPIMNRLKEENKELNPNMILVSTSRIPSYVRERLSNYGIAVIMSDDEGEIVSDLSKIVTHKEESSTKDG